MKITRAEVENVARLARLALKDEELDALTGQMDTILGYVEKLNELDTGDIVPTAHAVGVEEEDGIPRIQEVLVKGAHLQRLQLDRVPVTPRGTGGNLFA